jgi:hypothetical protein
MAQLGRKGGIAIAIGAMIDAAIIMGQAGSFGMALVAESGTALDVSFTNDINPSPDRDGRISAEQRRGLSSLAGLVHLRT